MACGDSGEIRNPYDADGRQLRSFATDAGGCPAASPFLLLRQKKVTKEKATPGSSALTGYPALLTNAGRCGTRARSGITQMVFFVLALRQSSRNAPVVSALLGDSHRDPVAKSPLSRPRRPSSTFSLTNLDSRLRGNDGIYSRSSQ